MPKSKSCHYQSIKRPLSITSIRVRNKAPSPITCASITVSRSPDTCCDRIKTICCSFSIGKRIKRWIAPTRSRCAYSTRPGRSSIKVIISLSSGPAPPNRGCRTEPFPNFYNLDLTSKLAQPGTYRLALVLYDEQTVKPALPQSQSGKPLGEQVLLDGSIKK